MAICYIGIGSNLGNRRRNIRQAIEKINALKDTKALKVSRLIETKAQGGPRGQPRFLNAALKLKTGLPAKTLLKKFKEIERELGRRAAVRYGPRAIDLDILLYGDKIINTKGLSVPHPRMFERDFVLKPLREVI